MPTCVLKFVFIRVVICYGFFLWRGFLCNPNEDDEDEQFFVPIFTINGAPVEWNRQGKTDNSEKNLSQCHFVHHKSHTWDRTPGLRGERPATNRLSHGTAVIELHLVNFTVLVSKQILRCFKNLECMKLSFRRINCELLSLHHRVDELHYSPAWENVMKICFCVVVDLGSKSSEVLVVVFFETVGRL